MDLVSINPATQEEIGCVAVSDARDVERKIQRLRSRRTASLDDRIGVIRGAARILRRESARLAELMTREQGKPIRESKPEVDNAADRLDYFADNAAASLAPWEERVGSIRSVTRFQPLGVVGAIKPWNFPIGIPLWTIGPAILAGNGVLFKPSERTPLLGQRIVEAFREAGTEALEVVHGADDVGRVIVASDVDMISFVGSQRVGREIMRGSADKLRKLTLELGGKDPMIVCADADLEAAISGAVWGAFKNCGQVCCGVERVYVEKRRFDTFLECVVERTKKLKVGNGLDPATEIGPMNREEEVNRVERHLTDAVEKGARILCGGKRLDGLFFGPTVVTGIRGDMLLAREETFGPVMPVTPVENVDEAIMLANATEFGLTASVWSRDVEKAGAIAGRLQAGTIGINQAIGSMVQCLWGGVKRSGIGRMLGWDAAREFTQTVNYRFPS